jgi:hypothetical protein
LLESTSVAVSCNANQIGLPCKEQGEQGIADKWEQEIAEEGDNKGLTVLGIAAGAGLDQSATDAEVLQAVQEHLQGLRGTEMLTDVDIAALAAVVQDLYANISTEVFNPTYTNPSLSLCYADRHKESDGVICIAHVWSEWLTAYLAGQAVPEDSGPLNHFVVVQPTITLRGWLEGDLWLTMH